MIRFQFETHVSLTGAEMSLHLAMFAVEGLLGRARVRLDAKYELNPDDNSIAVDDETEVGAAIVRVFTGFVLREFGETSFEVEHVHVEQHELERTATA